MVVGGSSSSSSSRSQHCWGKVTKKRPQKEHNLSAEVSCISCCFELQKRTIIVLKRFALKAITTIIAWGIVRGCSGTFRGTVRGTVRGRSGTFGDVRRSPGGYTFSMCICLSGSIAESLQHKYKHCQFPGDMAERIQTNTKIMYFRAARPKEISKQRNTENIILGRHGRKLAKEI